MTILSLACLQCVYTVAHKEDRSFFKLNFYLMSALDLICQVICYMFWYMTNYTHYTLIVNFLAHWKKKMTYWIPLDFSPTTPELIGSKFNDQKIVIGPTHTLLCFLYQASLTLLNSNNDQHLISSYNITGSNQYMLWE